MFVGHKRQTLAQASDSANAARLGLKIQSPFVTTLSFQVVIVGSVRDSLRPSIHPLQLDQSMSELRIHAEMAAYSIEPEELHGMVCGMAVNGNHEFVLGNFIDFVGIDALSDQESLGTFVNAALDELHDQNMIFQPLVADDEDPIGKRVETIANWAGGFLAGFAAGLDGEHADLPVDVQEIIKDLVALSSLDPEDYREEDLEPGEMEEHEASLVEVHEYVRVSTMLILALMDEHVSVESAID